MSIDTLSKIQPYSSFKKNSIADRRFSTKEGSLGICSDKEVFLDPLQYMALIPF
jgi:hypothetical protein